MRIKIYFLLIIVISICYISAYSAEIKPPEFSGSFYPSNPNELNEFINNGTKEANAPAIDGEIIGILVPHAGYIYSGKIAACAYKTIEGKQFDDVIIIASAHQHYLEGIAVYPDGFLETPLGKLEVDSELAGELKQLGFATLNKDYFSKEHPIEVQLPFITKTIKNTKILPIVMGNISLENLKKIAQKLGEVSRKKHILIIASSDMSHFHTYEEAVKLDSETIDFIKNKDISRLWASEEYAEGRACGIYPVITLLLYSDLKNSGIEILKYANSGDTSGNKDKVVGYVSAISYIKPKPNEDSVAKQSEDTKKEERPMQKFVLNDAEKTELLKIARETLESYLKTGKVSQVKTTSTTLTEKRGAFVTLKKNGELRGCIGRIVADMPLYKAVSSMAIDSAVNDPRFEPVNYTELNDIKIEISVLTPFEKVKNIDEIEVGKHGLLIRKGFYSGLLLPQVPLEYGWNRQTFLEHTCLKAGLSPDSYKDKDAILYKFSAIVFGETDSSK